jgi:hypothetical protein
MSCEESNLS